MAVWAPFLRTAARDSDSELMPEGYPRSSFDAEEAAESVGSVFDQVEAERAEIAELPLWLTKRGVLVRATKE